MSPHGDREWTGEPSQPTPLPAQTPFTVGDGPPVLTLDEAGVERLAAAIANVGGYEGDLDDSLRVTFEEERAGSLARAIVEALRRD